VEILQKGAAVVTDDITGIGFAAVKLFVAEGATSLSQTVAGRSLTRRREQLGTMLPTSRGDRSKLARLDRRYETVRPEGWRADVVFANVGLGGLR
jgi:NAD(P)-dependent dehydrogenase (short-subunit alcohol dehydrogenase family)